MHSAATALQRPADARLLLVDPHGRVRHRERAQLARYLLPGDLLVANDAATIPASLRGTHQRSGAMVEIRLAGRQSLAGTDVREFTAVAFGPGDHRTRTEDRAPPPALQPGDGLTLGPLQATVLRLLNHPRLITLRFAGTPDEIWAAIARHGTPVQYANLTAPLALWDVWTRVAARPVAFEAPSAGFVLDWEFLKVLQSRRVAFTTLTQATGLSSTGDAALDARLPLDESYEIPEATARAIATSRVYVSGVVAVGTSVTRALEHAATSTATVRAGAGMATQRIGPHTRLRVVDAIITGVHEPGTSHYELLRAFADDATLQRAHAGLELHGYRTHEFGDSMMLDRQLGCRTSRGRTSSRAESQIVIRNGCLCT